MTEPRWLDDTEQRVWRRLLAVAAALPGALDTDLRAVGLTHPTYVVLAMLSEAPDRTLRMAELARRASSSPSRLTHTVTRLEQRGLVVRAAVAGDGRGATATLTGTGWDVVVRAAPTHVATVRRLLFDGLTPAELSTLDEVGAHVAAQLMAPPPTRRSAAVG